MRIHDELFLAFDVFNVQMELREEHWEKNKNSHYFLQKSQYWNFVTIRDNLKLQIRLDFVLKQNAKLISSLIIKITFNLSDVVFTVADNHKPPTTSKQPQTITKSCKSPAKDHNKNKTKKNFSEFHLFSFLVNWEQAELDRCN